MVDLTLQLLSVPNFTQNKTVKQYLMFSVNGCPDFTPPANALSERTGNTMTVRCADSDTVWTLTCENEKWVGQVENCTSSKSIILQSNQ